MDSNNGIVVYNLYAQFFNSDTEDCGEKQDWSFPHLIVASGLKLTGERRRRFNELVVNINNAIQKVVDEVYHGKNKVRYKTRIADWDPWPREGVVGQFCDPGSSGVYPDPFQSDLQFFKPNTYTGARWVGTSKRDIVLLSPKEEEGEEQEEAMLLELTQRSPKINIYDTQTRPPRTRTPQLPRRR